MKKLMLDPKQIEMPRSPNNYDTNALSDATGLECKDPSLTQQQFAEESDINFIADKFGLTGELPTVLNTPTYGDFSGIFDYQSAQNAIVEAQREFLTLPAKLRARFNHDPQQLLEFMANQDNRAEAEFLGLVDKPRQEAPESPPSAPEPKAGPKGHPTPQPSPEGSGTPPKGDKKDT